MDPLVKEVLETSNSEEVYNSNKEETRSDVRKKIDIIREISDNYEIQKKKDIETILQLTFDYFWDQIKESANNGYRHYQLTRIEDIKDPVINSWYKKYGHCIKFRELDEKIVEMFKQEGFELDKFGNGSQGHW